MKKLIALLLAVLMVFSLAACGSEENPAAEESSASDAPAAENVASDEPIIIGLMDAFSGDRAMSGMYAKEAAEMFIADINAAGGVLGRELVVVYEDDQGNEAFATNAFQKITAENELSGIVLTKYSSVDLAVEPFLDEAGVPAICCGSSQKIADTESEYLYSTRKSERDASVSYAKACEAAGMTKVCILHCPDATGTGLSPLIAEQLEKLGIEVLSIQQFGADEKSFAPYIAKMVAEGCDGIVSVAQQTEAALIMVAVAEADLDIPCVGHSAFCQQTAINNSGEACNGWYSVTAWSPNITTEPAKSWVERYISLYDHAPDMSSALTYDAMSIFCDAMERCGSSDPEDVKNAIREIKDFEGLASIYTYNEGLSMLATSEFLCKIENQQSIVLEMLK